MQIEPLFYALFIKDDTWARVYVNDLPLYIEKAKKGRSVSEPFNEYLVPGKNTVSIEVLRSPDLTFLEPERRWTVRFDVYRHTDALDPRKDISDQPKLESIFQKQFPDIMDEAEEKHRRCPFFYKTTFENPFDKHPEPVWRSAPEAEFDGEGNRGLREAVEELHTALRMQSADAFVDAMDLKMRHDSSAYDSAVYDRDQRREMREFVDFGPIVGDLDFADLHFSRLHDGRVAHVTRYDEDYVLDVRTKREPKVRLRMDLLMTQHNGKWRVFA